MDPSRFIIVMSSAASKFKVSAKTDTLDGLSGFVMSMSCVPKSSCDVTDA